MNEELKNKLELIINSDKQPEQKLEELLELINEFYNENYIEPTELEKKDDQTYPLSSDRWRWIL